MIANKLGLAVAEDYGIFFGLKDRGFDSFFPSVAVCSYFTPSLYHILTNYHLLIDLSNLTYIWTTCQINWMFNTQVSDMKSKIIQDD